MAYPKLLSPCNVMQILPENSVVEAAPIPRLPRSFPSLATPLPRLGRGRLRLSGGACPCISLFVSFNGHWVLPSAFVWHVFWPSKLCAVCSEPGS